jgi:hypothetical protein
MSYFDVLILLCAGRIMILQYFASFAVAMMISGTFFDAFDASTWPPWLELTFGNTCALNTVNGRDSSKADLHSGEVQGIERKHRNRIPSMCTSERLHCLENITKSNN